MSLHDPNHALSFADKVVLLGNGRICAQGKPLEVIRPETILDVYGIETKVLTYEGRNILLPVERLG
jgi:vitamin B12 transport system ATP-binding protein